MKIRDIYKNFYQQRIHSFVLKIKFFAKKHSIVLLILLFLTLLFCMMYIKYRITKANNEINKTKSAIEEQIILQQELKIRLQKQLSIENLKKISKRHLPHHSYTDSKRILSDKKFKESSDSVD